MRTPPLTGPAPSEDHGLGPIPVLRVRHAPDPVLTTPALPLKIDTVDVRYTDPHQVEPGPYSSRRWVDYLTCGLVNRMIRLMHEHDGVGIAAPQVGLADRVIVVQRQGCRDYDVWVNPVVVMIDNRSRSPSWTVAGTVMACEVTPVPAAVATAR